MRFEIYKFVLYTHLHIQQVSISKKWTLKNVFGGEAYRIVLRKVDLQCKSKDVIREFIGNKKAFEINKHGRS